MSIKRRAVKHLGAVNCMNQGDSNLHNYFSDVYAMWIFADGRLIVTSPVESLYLILPYLIKASDVGNHSMLLFVSNVMR